MRSAWRSLRGAAPSTLQGTASGRRSRVLEFLSTHNLAAPAPASCSPRRAARGCSARPARISPDGRGRLPDGISTHQCRIRRVIYKKCVFTRRVCDEAISPLAWRPAHEARLLDSARKDKNSPNTALVPTGSGSSPRARSLGSGSGGGGRQSVGHCHPRRAHLVAGVFCQARPRKTRRQRRTGPHPAPKTARGQPAQTFTYAQGKKMRHHAELTLAPRASPSISAALTARDGVALSKIPTVLFATSFPKKLTSPPFRLRNSTGARPT